jgi:hypothetical protein
MRKRFGFKGPKRLARRPRPQVEAFVALYTEMAAFQATDERSKQASGIFLAS